MIYYYSTSRNLKIIITDALGDRWMTIRNVDRIFCQQLLKGF